MSALCAAMFCLVLTGCNKDKFFTVTFDKQGGSAVAAITNVANGSIIVPPAVIPTKEDYGEFTDANAYFLAYLMKNGTFGTPPMVQIWPDAQVGNFTIDPAMDDVYYWVAEEGFYDLGGGFIVGDWLLYSGTINITKCNSSDISCVANLQMQTIFDWDAEVANPTTKSLKVTLNDVPLTAIPAGAPPKLNAIQKSKVKPVLVKSLR